MISPSDCRRILSTLESVEDTLKLTTATLASGFPEGNYPALNAAASSTGHIRRIVQGDAAEPWLVWQSYAQAREELACTRAAHGLPDPGTDRTRAEVFEEALELARAACHDEIARIQSES